MDGKLKRRLLKERGKINLTASEGLAVERCPACGRPLSWGPDGWYCLICGWVQAVKKK